MARKSEACAFCGKDPAEGFATINDERYCHESEDPTCYMLASWGFTTKEAWEAWKSEPYPKPSA